MKDDFDCSIATQKLNKIKSLKDKLDQEKTVDVVAAFQTMRQIKLLIKEALEIFDWDQLPIREKIAKEKHFSYVGKFNKYGIARAVLEPDQPQRHSGDDVPFDTTYKYSLINRAGEIVFPLHSSNKLMISDFSDGLACVYEDEDGSGDAVNYYIDETGKRKTDKSYIWARIYKNGVALVKKKDDPIDCYYLIDHEGNEVKKIELNGSEKIGTGETGYVRIMDRNWPKGYYITPEGKRIPETGYFSKLGDLNNGIAVVEKLDVDNQRAYNFYINQQGKRLNGGVLAEDLAHAYPFYEDRTFVVTKEKEQCLIDKEGKIIKKFPSEEYGSMLSTGDSFEGLCVFRKAILNSPKVVSKFQIVNTEGDLVLSQIYYTLNAFSEGKSFGSRDGHCFIVYGDGDELDPKESFDGAASGFHEGVAKVFRKVELDVSSYAFNSTNEYFYIDKKGRRVFS